LMKLADPDLVGVTKRKVKKKVFSMKIMFSSLALAAALSLPAAAIDPDPSARMAATLQGAKVLQLPAAVAELVTKAPVETRASTTITAVKIAVQIRPASAAMIVAGVAKAAPEMAPVAAAAAAALLPDQAPAIAKAAAISAPGQAVAIVEAVCRAAPPKFVSVAAAGAEVSPAAGKDILHAVGAGVPVLKPLIEQAMRDKTAEPVPAAILSQVSRSVDAKVLVMPASPLVVTPALARSSATTPSGATAPLNTRGPVIGPPYVPLPGTPRNVYPGSGTIVPEGGRNYCEP
jgi:hypothetical protein